MTISQLSNADHSTGIYEALKQTIDETNAEFQVNIDALSNKTGLSEAQIIAALQASLTLAGTASQIVIDTTTTPGTAIFKLATRTKVDAVETQHVRRKNAITGVLRVGGYLDDAVNEDGEFTSPSATTSTPEQFSLSIVVPTVPNTASAALGDITFATPLVGEQFHGECTITDNTNGSIVAGALASITSAGCVVSRNSAVTLVAGRSYTVRGRISQISSAT